MKEPNKTRRPERSIIPGLAWIVAVLVACSSCSKPQDSTPPPVATPVTNAPAQIDAGTNATPARFSALVGRWIRLDGDYLLEIRGINGAGEMEAGYFNPDPIKVSKALAIKEGEETKVFVELRDVNYPGCTYTLVYASSSDQLSGTYYQAAMQQTYDVVFSRFRQ